MSLLATSLLTFVACSGKDDLFSPATAAPVAAKVDASVDLDIRVTEDTIAVGDTATVYAIGSKAGTGEMSYYAVDSTVLNVNHKTAVLRGMRLGRTRLIGVLQVPGYPVTYLDMVVAATGSARKPMNLSTSQPATITPVATTPVVTTPVATTPVTSVPVVQPPATTASSTGPAAAPELPRVTVDVTAPAQTGRTIRVAAGGDLQAAINSARAGDVITLDPNATFVGNFTLPARGDAGWVTIRSSATDASLPAAGVRLRPAAVGTLPKILTNNAAPALRTLANANGWRLFAVEISATSAVPMSYGLLALGDANATSLSVVPSRLILDRVYVHGNDRLDLRRCVALNSGAAAIVNSTITDCHSNIGDSQAIFGWNGPGPYRIENNYMTAGHEVVGFGGQTPMIYGVIPSDIVVRHNHLTRPMSWQGVWNAKNLFELKAAQRLLLEDNVMENNWVSAQNGFAVLFQVLAEQYNDVAAFTKITDITMRNNIVRNTPGGVNLYARVAYNGKPLPTYPMARVAIYNNTFDVGQNPALGDNGRIFQLLSDLHDVRIEGNTASGRVSALSFDLNPTVNLTVVGNVFGRTDYPIIGNSTGEGKNALLKFAPGGVFSGNVLVGANAANYPAGNSYPAGGNLPVSSLTSGGYRTSTGAAAGANIATLNSAVSGVVQP